jgi:hypothetical protein
METTWLELKNWENDNDSILRLYNNPASQYRCYLYGRLILTLQNRIFNIKRGPYINFGQNNSRNEYILGV